MSSKSGEGEREASTDGGELGGKSSSIGGTEVDFGSIEAESSSDSSPNNICTVEISVDDVTISSLLSVEHLAGKMVGDWALSRGVSDNNIRSSVPAKLGSP